MAKQKQPFPNPLDNVLKTGKIGGASSTSTQPDPQPEQEEQPPQSPTLPASVQPAPVPEEPDNLKTVNTSSQKVIQDKATLQFTAYFTTQLYAKLKRFELEILERTGRKTDPNKIIRQLVEKATIEDILPLYEK
jgi:hypothetical protein